MMSPPNVFWASVIAAASLACTSKSTFEGGSKSSTDADSEATSSTGPTQTTFAAETTTSASSTTTGSTNSDSVTSQRPCNTAADCLADFPLCEDGLCTSCAPATNAGCHEPAPYCVSVAASPTCVECLDDAACGNGVCMAFECQLPCSSDGDCSTGEPHCSTAGVCVECGPDAPCSEPNHTCSEAGACVECLADADCPLDAPSCSQGACLCELDINELSTDPNNCGTCGTTCGEGQICARGTCSEPTASRLSLAPGGGVAKNSVYTLVFSAGESPGGNGLTSNQNLRLQSGLVGASAE